MEQAAQAVELVRGGGVAIVPTDVCYVMIGHGKVALERIYAAKNRSLGKPSGAFGNLALFNELHVVNERARDMVRALVVDHDLPVSVVAPFRKDHPMFQRLDGFVKRRAVLGGTLDILLNAGVFHDEMTRIAHEKSLLIVGSSANLSLTGAIFRLDEVNKAVRAAADFEVDGGPSKYANDDGLSSTIIDLRRLETIRPGVCYDRIREVLRRDFAVELAEAHHF
jgi:tRNA A37 threonylcarbamoyladenosine synthetase subunit TsaC/SUA5/YrdC